jgi:hypothetical protein
MLRKNVRVYRDINYQDNVHEADAVLQPVVGEPLHQLADTDSQAALAEASPNEEYRALLYRQFVAELLWDCEQKREQH